MELPGSEVSLTIGWAVSSFRHNTSVWRTDRQTDGQTYSLYQERAQYDWRTLIMYTERAISAPDRIHQTMQQSWSCHFTIGLFLLTYSVRPTQNADAVLTSCKNWIVGKVFSGLNAPKKALIHIIILLPYNGTTTRKGVCWAFRLSKSIPHSPTRPFVSTFILSRIHGACVDSTVARVDIGGRRVSPLVPSYRVGRCRMGLKI